ncbi:hypothetical protein [Jannaschia donghaensis]|uniref:Uncharacterized protein n=1 Tax=Jannaschia donghaensis TaxID=420998 RepID=A0A0M6YDU5_9RHOB|nr:hypothetical protein [Jannaschia donghaensis]CTQ48498.1 hypothetical protein JDO7802_00500 [Jannaschia donghaensis]
MADKQSALGKAIDAVTDRLSELLDSLGPQPERIRIPVRNDDRRGPR